MAEWFSIKGFLTQTCQTNVFSTQHTEILNLFEFIMPFSKILIRKKKKRQTWWYFTKRAYFGIFKAEFLMSTTKVITQILTEVSETVNKCHCYQ